MLTTDVRARSDRDTSALWPWGVVGSVGAIGVAVTATTIGSRPRPPGYHWWLYVPSAGYTLAHLLFYASVALLTAGWLGVGVRARCGRLTVADSWRLLVLWGAPLWLATPLFSRDIYSYVAQGELVRHGFNPYVVTPSALGAGPVLSSIAVVWRDTTSPYGPLFVMLSHLTSLVTSQSLIAQVLAFRALELVGVALLMLALPAVARHFGADGAVAVWLGVLSPLALFSAVSSAHNDTLMIGLMMVALLAAVRESRYWALALFSLAATIKLPAVAGIIFVTVAALRHASPRRRARLVGEALVIPAVVIAGVTELAGNGWRWLAPSALSIPTQLRVLTTPVVSIAKLAATSLRAVGLQVANATVVTAAQHVAELLAVIAVAALATRTRRDNVARHLGVALLVVVIASPTVWPWYFLWGVTVLAVTSAQRSLFLAGVGALAMLLVGPGGTPMIGGNGFYVSGPLVLAGIVWFFACGQWRRVVDGVDRVE